MLAAELVRRLVAFEVAAPRITMAVLLRNHRPLYFFSSIAVGLLVADGV